MHDFEIDSNELQGSLLTLEFGPKGQVTHMWVTDPELPDEGEDFQFILPPMAFGDEYAEDYYPGSVLIAVRHRPDEPWIFDRVRSAATGDHADDLQKVQFQYEFTRVPDLRVTGTFFEQPGAMPVVIWSLTLENLSGRNMEIGDLALPFAFHNLLDGGGSSDAPRNVYRNRVYIHKAIGGSASFLMVQRISGEPPGLLVYPGEETVWERFASVPSSAQAPHAWEGIPMVFLCSAASAERDGSFAWTGRPNSILLEPGDSRTFQTRFAPVDQRAAQDLPEYLEFLNQPSVRLLPSAVAPYPVGIAIEVSGTPIHHFENDQQVRIESEDVDENGGFAFVRPQSSGPLRMSFVDDRGRAGSAQLMFLDPIETTMDRRAEWLVAHQYFESPGHSMDGAFLPASNGRFDIPLDPEWLLTDYAVYCGLGESLFLAEKNVVRPNRRQIELLDKNVRSFILENLQNPGTCAVGCEFQSANSVATDYGDPEMYIRVALLYLSLARIQQSTGLLSREVHEWINLAARTVIAMFRFADRNRIEQSGLLLFSELRQLRDAPEELHDGAVGEALALIDERYANLARLEFDFRDGRDWSSEPFEDLFEAAVATKNRTMKERIVRCAIAAKGVAPCWWWFGVDKALFEGVNPHPKLIDNAELCLTPPTVANSALLLRLLTQDMRFVPKHVLRAAYGGLLAAWTLVGPEGQSAAGFCPDTSSEMAGFLPITGDTGATLYLYLRNAASYLLRGQVGEALPLGCVYDADAESYTLNPWDGVGQRVVVGLTGVRVSTTFGSIEQIVIDRRKRWARLFLANLSDVEGVADIVVEGLWGSHYEVDGEPMSFPQGPLRFARRMRGQVRGEVMVSVRHE